jgi:hypothetical protein
VQGGARERENSAIRGFELTIFGITEWASRKKEKQKTFEKHVNRVQKQKRPGVIPGRFVQGATNHHM